METEAIMRVSDLQFGAYLMARGYSPVRCEGTEGRKVFVFEGVPDRLSAEYAWGNDQVSARQLFTAYHHLKRLAMQRA